MKNTLKVERAKLDLSQKELANKVNVSRQTIHAVERGKKVPSVKLALRIAKVFRVQVEDIFQLESDD